MDRSGATRIIHAWEAFAAAGRGDVKALLGAWRVFFSLDRPGHIVVTDADNCGPAY